MPDAAQPEAWWVAPLNWIFANGSNGDLTLLGVIFTINAGFSSLDILIHNIVTPLRAKLRKRLSKYRDANWMRAIAPSETERDQGKREVLAALVNEVASLEAEIPELFKGTSRRWKRIMAVTAALTVVLMAIPYTGRIVILLSLTVPLFYWRCRKELDRFNKKLEEACGNLDKNYNTIKASCVDTNSSNAMETQLAAMESKIPAMGTKTQRGQKGRKKK